MVKAKLVLVTIAARLCLIPIEWTFLAARLDRDGHWYLQANLIS